MATAVVEPFSFLNFVWKTNSHNYKIQLFKMYNYMAFSIFRAVQPSSQFYNTSVTINHYSPDTLTYPSALGTHSCWTVHVTE